jgi:hypothetical protein
MADRLSEIGKTGGKLDQIEETTEVETTSKSDVVQIGVTDFEIGQAERRRE